MLNISIFFSESQSVGPLVCRSVNLLVCWSIGLSIGPSIGLSISPSVGDYFALFWYSKSFQMCQICHVSYVFLVLSLSSLLILLLSVRFLSLSVGKRALKRANCTYLYFLSSPIQPNGMKPITRYTQYKEAHIYVMSLIAKHSQETTLFPECKPTSLRKKEW